MWLLDYMFKRQDSMNDGSLAVSMAEMGPWPARQDQQLQTDELEKVDQNAVQFYPLLSCVTLSLFLLYAQLCRAQGPKGPIITPRLKWLLGSRKSDWRDTNAIAWVAWVAWVASTIRSEQLPD